MKLHHRKHELSRRPQNPRADEALRAAEQVPALRFDLEKEIGQEAWDEMKEELDSKRESDWWGFSYMAMRVALLYPDRKEKLGLDNEAWDEMKEGLDSMRGSDWWGFSDIAMPMHVLANDSRITEDGKIEIRPPSAPLSSTPNLPEQPSV